MSKKPAPKPPHENAVTKRPDLPEALQQEIDRQIGPLVNQGQREQIVLRMTQIMTSEQFSGPIAHPRHLREYDTILPGSAERIVTMAEKAQSHNQDMEATIVRASIFQSNATMILGFVALVALIGLAVYAGMNGNNVLAGLLLASGAFGGAATLIRGWANGVSEPPMK